MIKQIEDIEYIKLLEFYVLYQNELPTRYSTFISSKLLNEELMKPNSLALGLYKNKNLVGFILGYGEHELFNFNSMYVDKKYRYYVKQFLNDTEKYIKTLGYKGWLALSVTEQSNKMFLHYKAKPVEIKYYKEL